MKKELQLFKWYWRTLKPFPLVAVGKTLVEVLWINLSYTLILVYIPA